MRDNTADKTLYRNYVNKWKYMIKDYDMIGGRRTKQVGVPPMGCTPVLEFAAKSDK